MRISNLRKIEIVSFHKEFSSIIPSMNRQDFELSFLQFDDIKHISELTYQKENIIILLLTPRQFVEMDKLSEEKQLSLNESKNIGICLLEDPSNLSTVKLRKKVIPLAHKYRIPCHLKNISTRKEIIEDINFALEHLFKNIEFTSTKNLLEFNEVQKAALYEVSNSIQNKSVPEFLRLMLEKCALLTDADAGFIFTKKNLMEIENHKKHMIYEVQEFELAHEFCKSHTIELKKEIFYDKKSKITQFMCNESLSFSAGKQIAGTSIMDPDKIPNLEELSLNLAFDSNKYKINSYCAVPFKRENSAIEGYILLINKVSSANQKLENLTSLDNHVVDFSIPDLKLIENISHYFNLCVEKNKFALQIRNIFQCFTTASLVAIESRDPTTRGHSERVAILTVGLAEAINRNKTGQYGSVNFTKEQVEEIRYASLLHDFGKIGVKEHILHKEKKLYSYELEQIKHRFTHLRDKLYINILEAYLGNLVVTQQVPTHEDFCRCKDEIHSVSLNLENYWDAIKEVNEPTVLNHSVYEKIAEIAGRRIIIGEQAYPVLTPNEISILSLQKGSLSVEERREIETHVTHSYNFLVQIPWSTEFKDIPEIVIGHHERLDGSGYPRKLKGDEIPIQAKMMAITDIFDALVAHDRPYKKSLSYERALSILEMDVKNGKLDAESFRIFVEAKIGELTLNYKLEDLKIA